MNCPVIINCFDSRCYERALFASSNLLNHFDLDLNWNLHQEPKSVPAAGPIAATKTFAFSPLIRSNRTKKLSMLAAHILCEGDINQGSRDLLNTGNKTSVLKKPGNCRETSFFKEMNRIKLTSKYTGM
jgi:hypothetical protein